MCDHLRTITHIYWTHWNWDEFECSNTNQISPHNALSRSFHYPDFADLENKAKDFHILA